LFGASTRRGVPDRIESCPETQMRSTRQLSITLPDEMADWVKDKTASGPA
jgi:hypothetical protein